MLLTLLNVRAEQEQLVDADTVPQSVQKPPGKRLGALLNVGQQLLREQRFYEAEAYFKEAMAVDEQCADAYYYLAECQRHRFRYAEALDLYKTARRLAPAHPEAEFYHALMLKYTGAYRAAQQALEEFVVAYQSSDQPSAQQLIQRAKAEGKGIALAYQLFRQPAPEFSFHRLPGPVNSPFHDFAALPWQHDSSLIVSSARRSTTGDALDQRDGAPFSDFLWLQKQLDWQIQPTPAGLAALNSRLNEGSGSFNRPRDQFYFTACYQDSTCWIMRSSLVDEKWSEPVALGETINELGYNAKHPALSPGGDTLYFASDRPGGYGQYDLWMSTQSDGMWQLPTNLGEPINTAFQEVSPAYFEDEQSLVFSSDAPTGIGGYDLYVAYGAAVTNLGYPFNSSQDDWYLRLGERQAFLTSNRGNEDGNFDVYTFRIQSDTVHALARLRPAVEADWYELQFASADLFAEEDFYHQLPYADKEKVNQYVNRRAFREVLLDQLAQSDAEQYRYEALSEQDQQLVQRLARAKRQFLLREPVENLSEKDQRYYEQLDPANQVKIAYLVDEQLFRMLLQERSTMDPEVAFFYEALPTEDRQKVDRAISSQRTFYRQTLVQQPTLEDLFHYQSLPEAEKIELSRMITAQQFLEKAWDAQQPDEEAEYVYQSLGLAEQQQVDRYVRRRSFQQAVTESAALSAPEQRYYEKLSTEEKETINRLARAKKQFLLRETTDELSPADQQFYERLPTEERALVSRIVDAQVFSLLAAADAAAADAEAKATFAQLPPGDQERIERVVDRKKVFHQRTFDQLPTADEVFSYQALSAQEQERVGRLANARQFAPREPGLASLDEETKHFYETLPRSDQASIRRLATQRKQFLAEEPQDSLLAEDHYFLETLPPEEKQLVRRIIDAWVFDEIMAEEAESVQLAFRYQNLSEHEKRRATRLNHSRRLFKKLPEVDNSTSPDRFYVQEIAERGTERVTLSGRFASGSDFPHKAFLVNAQNDTLATASVDESGGFTFTNIAYHESDRVAFQRPSRSFAARTDYQLAELTVVPLDAPAEVPVHFSNIYFATNEHTLPAGATATLDSLMAFHEQRPEVVIEIRAFADSTGTRRYNEQLTQRRARSVQRYLLTQGVAPPQLSQLAMGAVTGDDLAYCRRVELRLGASSALPQSAQAIYIIQAQPDLQQIANQYKLSLDTLKEWNGGKESIPPYTPVRVIPRMK
ncbi:MAG: OmpA family protein [Tunicatimonas sp.]